MRTDPVFSVGQRPQDPALRSIMDAVEFTAGKATALADVVLLQDTAGYVTAAAAASPGTAVTIARAVIDFADAGIDSIRLVVRGANSGAGAITFGVYDVTNSALLATVSLTGASTVTATGDWTQITPTGSDQEVELTVIGAGAETPTLYTVRLQGRTVQVRR